MNASKFTFLFLAFTIAMWVFSPNLFSQNVLLFDDFEDGNSNGWLPKTSSNWYVVQDEGDYSYYQHNTGLVGHSQQLNEWSIYQNQSFDNIIYSVKIKSPENLSTNPSADCALIFNYQDDNNYHCVFFNSGLNETLLIQRKNAVESILVRFNESTIYDNNYHTVAVKTLDGQITILANNKVIISTTDYTFTTGKIGLGVRNDAAYFDHVFVTQNSAYLCDFWEDFNDNYFDGWTANVLGRWSTKFHDGDFALWLNTSSYNSSTEHNLGEIATIDNRNFDNFTMELDIKSSETSGNTNADLAIVFGYQDFNNYYYTILNRGTGNTTLRRLQNGISYDLDKYDPGVLHDQNWHHIKIISSNGSYSVHYDGQQILSGYDRTFTSGKIGVGSKNDSGFFDDICINAGSAPSGNLVLSFNQIEQSNFPTINCYVTVTDGAGNPIAGLTEANFTVQEEGVNQSPITVTQIGGSQVPVSVALVIDRSGSMSGAKLADAKNAANTFVNEMATNDKGAVISFSSNVTLNQGFTTNKTLLHNAINSLVDGGSTNLYDAIVEGVNQCNTQSGRKAIIALTDGVSSVYNYTIEQCIAIANNAGLPVYTIGLGAQVREADLRKIANETGGHYYYAPNSSDLENIYRLISQQIQNQYKITYRTNIPCPPEQRTVRITATYQGYSDTKSKSYIGNCTTSVPIFPTAPTAYYISGDEMVLDIQVGTSSSGVSDLFGVSYVLNYNNSQYIDVVTPYATSVVPGPFLGNDLVFFQDVNDGAGRVSLGVSRKTGAGGVSGYGSTARIRFRIVGSPPNNTVITFSLTEVSGINDYGGPIILDPQTFQIHISSGVAVWPGDTNNDGIVDHKDILPLGVYFGKTGTARANAPNNTWVGQQCSPVWNPSDATFVDCDGNGIVNQADVFGIGLNWWKTHTTLLSNNNVYSLGKKTNTAALIAECRGSGMSTDPRYVSIRTENIADLLGVAFELVASDNGDCIEFESIAYGDFLGDEIISYDHIDNSGHLISVGVTRKSAAGGVSGNGEIARIYYHEKTGTAANTSVEFVLANTAANDPNGTAIELIIQNASVALPVELSRFSANQTQKGIQLVWITGNEKNNFGFEVQRKLGSDDSWKDIGFVRGAGTSLQTSSYEFYDTDILFGEVNYRLKQMDVDGTTSLSDVISICIELPSQFVLDQNYPNPFNPITNISYQLPKQEYIKISIYNMNGQLVKTLIDGIMAAGQHSVSWDGINDQGQSLPSGTYLYELRSRDFKQVRKLVHMK